MKQKTLTSKQNEKLNHEEEKKKSLAAQKRMMSTILDNLLTSIKGRSATETHAIKDKTADILVDIFNKHGVYFATAAMTTFQKELDARMTSFISEIAGLHKGNTNGHN